MVRNADALGDRAGVHVTVIDVPAFLRDFQIPAAGEFGHALLKRLGLNQILDYCQSRMFVSRACQEITLRTRSAASPRLKVPEPRLNLGLRIKQWIDGGEGVKSLPFEVRIQCD